MLARWSYLRSAKLALTLNCGSSSIKYKLIDMNGEHIKLSGLIENIGESSCRHKKGADSVQTPGSSYETSMKDVIDSVKQDDVVKKSGLYCVGHRVVHGGETFSSPVVIDAAIRAEIERLCVLAPLHNPINLEGIRLAQKMLDASVPQVAVFDTAFHSTIPKESSLYAIPLEISEKYKIKRYGFHGISHKYVSLTAAKTLELNPSKCNLIIAHLGSGCSATAVKQGKSVDTTMGFTPLEGLVMSTRAGSLDPGVHQYMCNVMGMSIDEVTSILNKKSGLLGISGLSKDMRVLIAASTGLGDFTHEQRERATLAIDIFVDRLCQHIAKLFVSLDSRCDAIVFTGGIGENSAYIRQMVIEKLKFLGVYLDLARNVANGQDSHSLITQDDSPLHALVIPTDEELQIARESVSLIDNSSQSI